MAKPTTLSSAKMLLQIGDGAGPPEAFTAPCGLTTRGINFGKDTNDVTVPDCDDPDAPSWVERVTTSLSGTISGEGVLALEALTAWRSFFFSTTTRTVRMRLDGGTGWGYWQGKFHCTTFNVGGPLGEKIGVEIELVSDGEVTWVATV